MKNEQLKVTTNEQAWEYLQRAKQNLSDKAMKPKIANPEFVKMNLKMIDEVQYYLCPEKEQNEP